MALAVLGKESLDELTQLVVPLFAQVENKDISVPMWRENPVKQEHTQLQIHAVPLKDTHKLILTWPVEEYMSRPAYYLTYLFNHAGPGSLSCELKSKCWITSVSAKEDGPVGFSFLVIDFSLTPDGMVHTDDIIFLVFQYINMLHHEGPHKWIWDEYEEILKLSFSFLDQKNPVEYTEILASVLHTISTNPNATAKNFLQRYYLLGKYEPKLICSLLEQMVPRNLRVTIESKEFAGTTEHFEKWYGTPYSIVRIPENTLQRWGNAGCHEKLHLPAHNEFIPTNLELESLSECPTSHPVVIKENEYIRLWHKQDDVVLLPKSSIGLIISSPIAKLNPLSINHNLWMFYYLFMDAMSEHYLSAKKAWFSFNLDFNINDRSIMFSVDGFSDKQQIFLQRLIETLANFSVDPTRFHIFKDQYIRKRTGFKAEPPYEHAEFYNDSILEEHISSTLEYLHNMTVESLTQFYEDFFSSIYIEMLVYGNVTCEQALQLGDAVARGLHTETMAPVNCERTPLREVKLQTGLQYLFQRQHEISDSSALSVYFQCSPENTHNNVLLLLFNQIINEPYYDIMRTQQQLGYILYTQVRRSEAGVNGLSMIIQSDKHPEYLEEKLEDFLREIGNHIEDMPEDDFQNHTDSLASQILNVEKNLTAYHDTYWYEITTKKYNFDRGKMEADHVYTLTKDDITDFYNRCIAQQSPERRKLSVYILGKDQPVADVTHRTHFHYITHLNELKHSLDCYPLPKSYINILAQE